MSHNKLRTETNCLNCGAELYDRFCHKCGQENVEPKQSFGQLTAHFFEDLTHFDGKFPGTIKPLLTKPGLLTEEYVLGRRASYINPIRMYLFISATFFLLLMSVFPDDDNDIVKTDTKEQKAKVDSALTKVPNSPMAPTNAIKNGADTTLVADTATVDSADGKIEIARVGKDIQITRKTKSRWFTEETVAEYDSMQHSLPKEKRDGWFTHYFKRKFVRTRESSHKNQEAWLHHLQGNFYHSLPYVLFLSLPLIALLLKLLYVRRKQFYYVSHIIFMIHFYCFVFMINILSGFLDMCGSWGSIIGTILQLSVFIYLFIAMKRFYKQGGAKTMIKFFAFVSVGSFIVGLLALIALANAVLNAA